MFKVVYFDLKKNKKDSAEFDEQRRMIEWLLCWEEELSIYKIEDVKNKALITPKPFTEADLKDGMIAVLRNNSRCIVFNNKLMHDSNAGKEPLENYEDDLTYSVGEWNCFDIMQVKDLQGNVIWARGKSCHDLLMKFENCFSKYRERLRSNKEFRNENLAKQSLEEAINLVEKIESDSL